MQLLELDAATGTGYASSDEGTISVIDTRRCNARRASSCGGPVAELPGPVGSVGLAVYRRTLYVTSATDFDQGAISVYDISRCRTGDVSGCGAPVATLPMPGIGLGLAVDRGTGTMYVGNVGDRVDVLDVRTCRTGHLAGCGTARISTIPATDGPGFPIVDAATRTLYVPANGPGADTTGDHVDVVDLRHCRAGDTAGCGDDPGRLPTGTGPVENLLDPATHTLYVTNQTSHDVSVLDVAHCMGGDRSGCDQPGSLVPVGAGPAGGLVQTKDGRVLVGNQESDTLSVIATRHCRAGDTSGCPTDPAPTIRTGGAPFWVAYDAGTGTVFTVNHVDQAVGVVDAGDCRNADRGCRRLAPSLPGHQQSLADDAVHTWYGSDTDGKLTLTDTRVCTARAADRCAAAAIHTTQRWDGFITPVVDDATHTLYLALIDPDTFAGSLAAIDLRTCNATNHSDCSPVTTPMPLPNFIALLAIDPSTHTVYETTQDDNTLQVIDGAHCNAIRHTACAAPVGEVPFADSVFGVVADPVSKTVFVSEFGPDFAGHTVYRIDSRHCRAGDVTGCPQSPASFTSGRSPLAMVVDPATRSLFVLNSLERGDGSDGPGRVSIYDTRTCNGRTGSGCASSVAEVAVARSPFLGAIDPVTRHLYVSGFEHAAVSVIDIGRCNAQRTRNCRSTQVEVGDGPGAIAIDPATHSAFVQTGYYVSSYYFDTRGATCRPVGPRTGRARSARHPVAAGVTHRRGGWAASARHDRRR